ncbi:IS3 family transposase [Lysinibacillus sp. OF-1]|uniref:IS3 family transposase n=1 Tax=Lysinibacillus sp. OF-1 TaxID=2972483 RepID=UPI0023306F07|nr:IS3 family transposase [Lysinibacillus sp. OF-1]WCH50021.1 IS3 family transposase [Lysinibacillus sp. OF-1]
MQEKVRAIDELRLDFPLQALLKVANIKKSTYYYHLHKRTTPDKYEQIKERIQTLFYYHKGRYGYRRICLALRNEGFFINHKTVQRLMQEMGLKGTIRPKKYRSYKGTVGCVAENIIQRDFEATAPNQKWVTDVTEFKINGQKIYVSAILDLFNREIVGYEVSKSPNFELVQQSLKMAFTYTQLSEKSGLIIHSDQGWLYQIPRFKALLATYEIKQSMSRKGNCLDNAVIESFFGIMKSEFLYATTFKNYEAFKKALVDYIHYYNHERIKIKLNGKSPVEFRRVS